MNTKLTEVSRRLTSDVGGGLEPPASAQRNRPSRQEIGEFSERERTMVNVPYPMQLIGEREDESQRSQMSLRPGPDVQVVHRAETERRITVDVRAMRPNIPGRFSPGLIVFDSQFYRRQDWRMQHFDFRGVVMRGWEVNYYFQGMAAAHQGLSWPQTGLRIYHWNALQAAHRQHSTLSDEVTLRVLFAASMGYQDELRRR